MTTKLIALGLAAALALAGCSPGGFARLMSPDGGKAAMAPDGAQVWKLDDLTVDVPETLRVSEANRYLPIADIVWRGDDFGDRRAQVRALMEDAFRSAGADTGTPVDVAITVLRFHGVTEKARFTTGGNYAMHFLMTVTDAATGAVLAGPRKVRLDLDLYGAKYAVAETHGGPTEKELVTDYLREQFAVLMGHAPS